MDFDAFHALTFDCYGTLIDWERGILTALRSTLGTGAAALPPDEQLLERFGSLEADAEARPYLPYRTVLAEVAAALGSELGVAIDDGQVDAFASTVGEWPPFPDAVASLSRLASRYRLAVVSNVDDDLFEGSAAQLGAPFEHVVTAEQVRSYKPAPAHFHEVIRRLDLPAGRILHVAQSLYHDVRPAMELGLACVWVNRRAKKPGSGATRPAHAIPDHEVVDLAALVTEIGLD